MKLNTTDEAIEILQAAKAGKDIQRYLNKNWDLKDKSTHYNFAGFTYRIKPEPEVYYQGIFSDDSATLRYINIEPLKEHIEGSNDNIKIFKCTEILDEDK